MAGKINLAILKNLSYSLLLPLIRYSYGFALVILLSKNLPVAEYGQWSLLISTLGILITVASLNTMYSAQIILPEVEKDELGTDILTLGLFKLTFTFFVFLVVLYFLNVHLEFSGSILRIFAALLIFRTICDFVFGILRAQLRVKEQIVFFFVESALILAFVGSVILRPSSPVTELLKAFLLAEILAAALGIIILLRQKFTFRLRPHRLRKYFVIGVPLIPFAFLDLIVNAIAPIFIKLFDQYEAVAFYSIAQKVAMLILIPFAIINNVYGQYLKLGKLDGGIDGALGVMKQFFIIYILLLGGALLGLVFLGEWIIALVSTGAYIEAYPLMLTIAVANIVVTFSSMVTTLFAVYDKTRIVGTVWIIVLVAYIALSMVLIPKFDLYGAAYAMIISFGVGLIIVSIAALMLVKQMKNDHDTL
ncbi:MAG: oligosaccharide flippase family protein [Candidatus Marinimicrobia bacterium]|nr:oligosaccharide flippase family protein [Candidatus Neomarinimicrobiota bacterium]